MKSSFKYLAAMPALMMANVALAAGGDLGQVAKQATNWTCLLYTSRCV